MVNQEPGTFLIRLSESNPGTFAVGYTIDDPEPEKRVRYVQHKLFILMSRHYLIRPEDVYGAKKTLPDFLMENPQFSKFLVIHDFGSGIPKHRIVDKVIQVCKPIPTDLQELVLEPYGAKQSTTPGVPPNGYDKSLIGKAVK